MHLPLWPPVVAGLVLLGACSNPVKPAPTACAIAAQSYAAHDPNPTNPCQICDPTLAADHWSNQPAGTPCPGGGCALGGCQLGCTIGGLFFLVGGQNPKNPCEACEPALDGTAWTPQSGAAPAGSCGAGGVCANGACAVGCYVDGHLTADGTPNPLNGCEVCAVSKDPSRWSSVSAGRTCADGGGICGAGICVYGCEIGGVLFPATTHDPADACQICNPAVSGVGWSPWTGLSPGGCTGGQVCSSGTCKQGCFIDNAFIPNRAYAAQKDLCCNSAGAPGTWSPSFVQGDQYPSFGFPYVALDVGDFNGDGFPDVALSSMEENILVIFLEQDGGAFSSQNILSSNPQGAALLASADMNGDGKLDLIGLTYSGQAISVFLNLGGDAGFAPEIDTPSSVPANSPSFVVADINNDDRPDVIYADGDTTATILRNDGQGTLSAQPQITAGGGYVTAVQVGDFNRDGFIDLVALAGDQTGSQVNVLTNDGTGHFPTWTTAASFPPVSLSNVTAFQPCLAAVGDLNSDGFADIVLLGSSSLIVMSGLADGGFELSPSYSVAGYAYCGSVAVADFDGDGHPDVLVTTPTFNGESLSVALLRNSGNGVLEAASQLFVPAASTSLVTVADMNQDHALDLVVSDRLSWSVRFNGCPP